MEEEDARRESAIEILAAEAGETRWVLSTLDDRDSESMATATATATGSGTGLRVTRAGFAEIDGTGRDGGSGSGRRRFGRGSGKNEVRDVSLYSYLEHVPLLQGAAVGFLQTAALSIMPFRSKS